MKRKALILHLRAHGCEVLREGKEHSIYWNPQNRRTTAIPRRIEIEDQLARRICRDLGIANP